MSYYTVTYFDEKYDSRALWIGPAATSEEAIVEFNALYRNIAWTKLGVHSGIQLDGFCDLIADPTKKTLLKIKCGNESAPKAMVFTVAATIQH